MAECRGCMDGQEFVPDLPGIIADRAARLTAAETWVRDNPGDLPEWFKRDVAAWVSRGGPPPWEARNG